MKNVIMTAKPNTLATFDYLMLLGHALTEKTGFHYSVQSDFKNDCVYLVKDIKVVK